MPIRGWFSPEVLGLLREGKRNSQIADDLYIGSESVKSHLKSIYRKLGVHSRCEAITAAHRSSLMALASSGGDESQRNAAYRTSGRSPSSSRLEPTGG